MVFNHAKLIRKNCNVRQKFPDGAAKMSKYPPVVYIDSKVLKISYIV